jgi:hypothetical protein
MINKKTYGLITLGVIVMLGISFVAAYQGDYSIKGPNYSEDRHEAMQEAFENLDYDAWVSLMTENGKHPRVLDVVTEENFAKFVEMHEAQVSGNSELVLELRTELGLNQRMHSGNSESREMKQGNSQAKGQGNCPYLE